MNLKGLVPWWRKRSVPVRREEENPFLVLQREMNRIFDEFSREWFFDMPVLWRGERTGGYVPSIDVSEDEKEIRVTAELPGMDEKDIDISLSKDLLTIKGEKRIEKEDRGRDYYHVERSYGSFYRTIPLPDGVDLDKVEASFSKGVLTVRLPKTPEAQKGIKKIPVKAG